MKRPTEQETAQFRKESFQKWMEQPLVRAMTSMIPAGENPEMLVTLLESAFAGGFATGEMHILVHILTETMKARPNAD